MEHTTSCQSVIKRDGARQAFNPAKITSALTRAGQASAEFDAAMAQELCHKGVLPRLSSAVCPTIEHIQDVVEAVLYDAGFRQTLRAYIVYREQHHSLRRDRKTLVDVAQAMNEYLSRQDWRVHANANQDYSLGGLILNVSGKVTENYWLNHV